jgi:hypothetical protein
MKRKDLMLLIGVAFFTAIIGFVFSSVTFKTPQTRSTKVPTAGTISTNFPDINNDPSYNTIFNTNAVDPAVPLNASNTQNNTPFNSQ